jgi:PAS domain S-box-containing protein
MNTNEQQKPLILVADDDITTRMLASECLGQAGFSVIEAKDGREALELFHQLQPQAVMLDVLMPEVDGYDVCRCLRQQPGNENLPILLMTALDDVDAIDAAYEAGASEFSSKPVNWTIESHRLRSMLRAAEAAKEIFLSKQEWERTFNSLDEVVTIMDSNLTIVQANNAAQAAARNPLESIVGKNCCDAFHPSDSARQKCPIADVFKHGRKKIFEQVDESIGGTFLVSIIPVFDDTGNISRIVRMAKDITERQQLEAEVRRAQKMEAVGTLSGGLAHDFNNLLQVIIGYTSLASMKFKPDDAVYQQLEAVMEAAWRGNDITRQLLTVSRKTESRKQPLALNPLVKNVSKLLEHTIPKMIFLQQELGGDLWTVNADSAQLEQVLMNLAVNAKHAMPDGGSLIFETRNTELGVQYCRLHPGLKPGNYVMLSVTDTGCGMDKKTQSHIFEPFFTTRAPDEGTGLGLAMVYGIVKKHDGHLLCYSEVGEGTSFKVYLPAFGKDIEVVQWEPEVVQQTSGTETVLLVDDEPSIRHLAKGLLTKAGYTVLLAANGQEALDLYAKEGNKIEFVILDLNMPVMGGIECLGALQERAPDLPVLLASGFALNEETGKLISNKVGYIGKPYQEKEFLIKIREIIGGRNLVAV